MARIKRLSYRTGFVERLAEAAHLPHLPAITFEAADLTEDVLAPFDQHLLDLAGSYGDPNAGDLIPPVVVGVLKVNLAMAPSVYEARWVMRDLSLAAAPAMGR